MKLTEENYHSVEANKEYAGYSSFKTFLNCQAMYYAENITGDYERPQESPAMQLGKLVESMLLDTEEEHELFIDNNPEIYTASREPYKNANFNKAPGMVEAVKRQDYMMEYLEGETQKIITFEWLGINWKIKPDVLNVEKGFITDFKTTRGLHHKEWDEQSFRKLSWWEFYKYHFQALLYSIGCEKEYGIPFDFHLAAVTSEVVPDVGLYNFNDADIEFALLVFEENNERFYNIRHDIEPPALCLNCEYCKTKKVIHGFETLT